MTLLLPTVAAVAAILMLPGLSFYFDVVPKVVVILLGAALVFLVQSERPVEVSGPLRWFAIIGGAQAIVIVAATILSKHPQLSLIGGTWRRSGAIAEIAVLALAIAGAMHLAADRDRIRVLLRITVLASIPVSIYGILQYFGIDPILPAAGYHFGEGPYMIVRPPATLGHAAYFATYLLYAAFGGAGLVLREQHRAWKAAAIAASVLALFGIVLSGTRAAIAGFIVGAIFVIARERSSRKLVAGVAGFIALLAIFYISPAGERLRARAFWASEDRFGGSRLLLWRDSLRMSGGRWLIGYGPETFALEFPKHQSAELAREYPDFYHESPHNIFLDALDSKGVLGLAAMIALAALCLYWGRGAIGGAFVAMLVSQQFTTFTLATELYFYLAAAMIVCEAAWEGASGEDGAGAAASARNLPESADLSPALLPGLTAAVGFSTNRERPHNLKRWLAATMAIPFAGFAIYLATGDALLVRARAALAQGEVEGAARLEERARSWHMTADQFFALRFEALANRQTDLRARVRLWQLAMISANHAAESAEDRQNALILRASLQAAVNDSAGVEQTLREAIEFAPKFYKSHWLLAQVLELEGRFPEARLEAREAMDLGGDKHPEVVQTNERLAR